MNYRKVYPQFCKRQYCYISLCYVSTNKALPGYPPWLSPDNHQLQAVIISHLKGEYYDIVSHQKGEQYDIVSHLKFQYNKIIQ